MPFKYEAILMGASWGGIGALTHLLQGLPKDFSLPIIVILHRGKNYMSELDSVFQQKTALRVKEAEEKEPLLPGHVYIAPANYHLLVEGNQTFSLDISAPVHYSRPSIDVTFETAATVFKNRLVALLLTGADRDGASGLKTVAEHGGLTIVQDPDEAESSIMPKSALELSAVHKVLTLDQMKAVLMELHSFVHYPTESSLPG